MAGNGELSCYPIGCISKWRKVNVVHSDVKISIGLSKFGCDYESYYRVLSSSESRPQPGSAARCNRSSLS